MKCKKCNQYGHSTYFCKTMSTPVLSPKNETDTNGGGANTTLNGKTRDVLEVCKIPESLDTEELSKLIKDYIEPRVSYYSEKKRSPFIEDEFSEYYTAKCTDGIEIGGGNCAMDVITKFKEGIDAMCVIMNNNTSNEKSLVQNFKSSGVELDSLFKEKKDVEAVKLYTDEYIKKLRKIKNEKDLNDLYILAFISKRNEIFITCFKINLENISNVSSGGFIKNNKDKVVNIKTNNFINPSHGNVKLYKSKKRMELRLLPEIINNKHTVKIYTMP